MAFGFGRGKKAHDPAESIPMGAIVGAGQTYRVASYMDATRLTLLRQEWQSMSFDLYENEGHLNYATNFVGNAMARIKLVAARMPDTDEPLAKPETILTGPLSDAIAQISSPRGGQSGILRQLGKNIFLTGECWLISEEVDDKWTWDAVSIEELQVQGTSTTFTRRTLPGQTPIPLQEGSLTIRIWRESPRFSELADAGVRSCIDLLEKIIVLNRAEKAVARSRMAGSGILALPQELVPPAWQNQDSTGNPMEANPLWQALAESMTAPLKDDSHPSAVVPLLLVGPGDVIGKMKYEPMNRQFDSDAANKSISNAIDQIASSLELPREILLGVGEATHWSAWAIQEDTFRAHIQPFIEMICMALTRTYLQAALNRMSPEELKEAGIDDPSKIVVWYDASELTIRPDKSDKAIALFDRFAIGRSALRRETGFPETDKPGDKEYAQEIGIKMANPNMAVTGELPPPPPDAAPQPAPGGGVGVPKA